MKLSVFDLFDPTGLHACSLRCLRLRAFRRRRSGRPPNRNRNTRALALLLVLTTLVAARNSPKAASLQRKLDHIEANSRTSRPDQTPTIFTDEEVNAYLASDQIELPAGVQSVKLQFGAGTIGGTSRVDFDKALAGARSTNPLLSIFSGVHEVAVATHARGFARQGHVHVDSVSLDGIEVPNFVLQLFIEKYLQPKYPQIGLDSRFALPDRIDAAIVAEHQVMLTQK